MTIPPRGLLGRAALNEIVVALVGRIAPGLLALAGKGAGWIMAGVTRFALAR